MGQTAEVTGGVDAALLSRDEELGRIRDFLVGHDAACLVICGEPGIGKTSLLHAALEAATPLAFTHLRTRASEAEARLPFAALIDLVEGIDREVLLELPAPQSRALDIALRRADPSGTPADPMALSAAVLTAFRGMAARQRVLVAVDDVQWMDTASADPLVFAARRVAGDVRFLLTRRPGRASALEEALQTVGVSTVEVTGLSSGAIGRLLSSRLGLKLARPVLRHLHETCGGNPLFALELGRLLLGRPAPVIGDDLPVPHLIDDLFGPRVRQMTGEERRALLAASLTSGATQVELARVVEVDALDDSIAAGLLSLEGSRVWPSHPLLAAAMRHEASAAERRRMHLNLASAVEDPILQARHAALATTVPHASLAAQLEAAAALADERGAVHEAAELAAHAVRLTPAGGVERGGRLLTLARRLFGAGDVTGTADLLRSHILEVPPGRDRALARILLGEASETVAEDLAQIDVALEEASDDTEVIAVGLARKAELMCINQVARIAVGEALARRAVTASRGARPALEDRAMAALLSALVLRGGSLEHTERTEPPSDQVEAMAALQLAFRGNVAAARAEMHRLRTRAEGRGDIATSCRLQIWLCELELRAGQVAEAERHLQELHQWVGLPSIGLTIDRLLAQMAAVAGRPDEARRRGEETLMATLAVDYATWDRLEVTRSMGLAALLADEVETATEHFRVVWRHTQSEGVDDPGVFPVAADLVEACTRYGQVGEAVAVAGHLRLMAEAQQHPWGLATAARCEAVIALTGGYDDAAAEVLSTAAGAYGALDLYFDRARSLLELGRAQRRHKKRGAARQSLEAAAALFAAGGCTGWAARARAELARVSGRSAGDGGLTSSERRVVELAATGLSNKEIAVRLFVSDRTVEIHLSHAYAKLGVRSRSQLVGVIPGD